MGNCSSYCISDNQDEFKTKINIEQAQYSDSQQANGMHEAKVNEVELNYANEKYPDH